MAIRHIGDIDLTGNDPNVEPPLIDLRKPKSRPNRPKKADKQPKRPKS